VKMLSHVVPYSSLQCFWQYFLQNLLFLHLPALLHLTVQAVSSQVAGGGADVGGGGGGLVGAPTTGHSEEQNPHAPCPPTWSSLASVSVEHHGSVSPGALPSKMHSL